MPAPGTSGKMPGSRKIVTGALWRMAKNRAQPVNGSVATSVAIAGLKANSSTPKM